MRVESWRDAQHRDFIFLPDEIVLTPAGIRSGWHWHERSKLVVITIMPDLLPKGDLFESIASILAIRIKLGGEAEYQNDRMLKAISRLTQQFLRVQPG